MNAILLAIVLLLVGLTLLCMELFIPSAGILGTLSALTIVASVVVVFYYEGLGAGTLYLTGVTFVVGLALIKGLQWWPHTALGKRILNLPPDRDADIDPDSLDFLSGRIGLAKSKMIPSGMIVIDGKTYDAVSVGGPVDEGDAVRVVDVHGNRTLIRPYEASLPPHDSPGDDAPDVPLLILAEPDETSRNSDDLRPKPEAADTNTTDSPPNADLLFPDPFDKSASDDR